MIFCRIQPHAGCIAAAPSQMCLRFFLFKEGLLPTTVTGSSVSDANVSTSPLGKPTAIVSLADGCKKHQQMNHPHFLINLESRFLNGHCHFHRGCRHCGRSHAHGEFPLSGPLSPWKTGLDQLLRSAICISSPTSSQFHQLLAVFQKHMKQLHQSRI